MDKKKPDLDLGAVVAHYRPVVSFRVKKALGSANPDWEDVVNEILTQAIEKVQSGEFRGESSIGTFIYTIASRRIVDHIRQKSRVLKHAPEPNPYPDPRMRASKTRSGRPRSRRSSATSSRISKEPFIYIIIKSFLAKKWPANWVSPPGAYPNGATTP